MKRIMATLMAATAWTGVFGAAPAQAEPVSTFFIGIGAGFAAGGSVAISAYATSALGWGFAVGQFLAASLPTLLLAAGGAIASALQNDRMKASQVNFRQPMPLRVDAAGLEEIGGAILFAAHDGNGAFWYMVAHADAELMETIAIKLDNIEITLDGSNRVTTEEFIAESSGWFGTSSRRPYFSVWPCTFGPVNVLPTIPQAFKDAFPAWTPDHRMAGTTVTVVKIDPVKDEDRHGVYRWRGAIGLGEPAVSILGIWNRIYDPRDASQVRANRSTWKQSTNAALIWAWNRYRYAGFNEPMTNINWEKVASGADICDQPVVDRYDETAPRYAGGGMWAEDRENVACEQDILAGMAGVTLEDDLGRVYCVPAHYAPSTVGFSAARDILALGDAEANDGETAMDGVRVAYKEPSMGYVMQPCAPWKNPNFYQDGTDPRYLDFEVPFVKNHNQAVRLAKIFGHLNQPTRRLAPTVGLRGLRAKREVVVGLDIDDELTGDWLISMPVEVDETGTRTVFGVVPENINRCNLLAGEEGEQPTGDVVDIDNPLSTMSGLIVFAAVIAGSGSANARLEATFNTPSSELDVFELRFKRSDRSNWLPMIAITDIGFAYSEPVDVGWTYDVSWRTRRGPQSLLWSTAVQVNVSLDATPPGNVTSVTRSGGAGQATISWIAPGGNYAAARIYLNETNSQSSARVVRIEPGQPSAPDSFTITGLAAGIYYAWVEAINGSVVPSATRVATGAITVT